MIETTGVTVDLGKSRVLSNVGLTVERGTFVGLVGPNGAGKTTLLRTLNAAVDPDEGSVTVAGERIRDLPSRAASRLVATVPQNTSLSFDFDVRETVAMGRTPHLGRFGGWDETDRAAVDRAMERTDVTALADRPITAVSGGERQRVLVARALTQETPVLLLDEPTASLDINHQVRTLELVRDLVSAGKTTVAAIHDLNLAARYCDELLLMNDGGVLASGSPASVLTEANVEDAFDVGAVVSRHPVTGATDVTALPDAAPRGDGRDGRVHVVGGGGSGARYLHLLSAAGYDVSTGALNEGDTDADAAGRLGLDAVTVPPYAPVDDEAHEAVEARVRAADATLVADAAVGEGNVANLDAAAAAESLLLVEGRSFAERNYAGQTGERAYAALRRCGRVVQPGEVLPAVRTALDGSEGGSGGHAGDERPEESAEPGRDPPA